MAFGAESNVGIKRDSTALIGELPFPGVPTGTNGGVSVVGTLASALGGMCVGCSFWASSSFPPFTLQGAALLGLLSGFGGSMVRCCTPPRATLPSLCSVCSMRNASKNSSRTPASTTLPCNVFPLCGQPAASDHGHRCRRSTRSWGPQFSSPAGVHKEAVSSTHQVYSRHQRT